MPLNPDLLRNLSVALESTPYSIRWQRDITASEYDQLRVLVFKLYQAVNAHSVVPNSNEVTESRLRSFGYVNRRETPRTQRCNALRTAISNGMNPQEIINFLRYLIQRNIDRRSMQDALNRYQDDIDWIESNFMS
jgi:hypothetical protein